MSTAPGWVEWLGIVAGGIASLGVILAAARGIWRGTRRVARISDEILGVPAEGARPAVPGWGERLDGLTASVNHLGERLDEHVRHHTCATAGSCPHYRPMAPLTVVQPMTVVPGTPRDPAA